MAPAEKKLSTTSISVALRWCERQPKTTPTLQLLLTQVITRKSSRLSKLAVPHWSSAKRLHCWLFHTRQNMTPQFPTGWPAHWPPAGKPKPELVNPTKVKTQDSSRS